MIGAALTGRSDGAARRSPRSTPRTRLRRCRARFALPDGVIYLDGNSLGALPKATAAVIEELVRREWGEDLITSWNSHGWIDLPRRVGAKIARLIGAAPDEVLVADSTSVNLFKLIAAAPAAAPRPARGPVRARQLPDRPLCRAGPARAARRPARAASVERDEIAAALDERTALSSMLTHVDYRSGRLHDMAGLTAAAHAGGRAGALGPRAQRRRDAARPAARRRRSRGRLRLQVSERRARARPPSCSSPSAGRTQRASRSAAGSAMREPFAFEPVYRPAAGHRALPGRHAADPEPEGAGGRRRPAVRGRSRGVAQAKSRRARRLLHPAGRGALRRHRL